MEVLKIGAVWCIGCVVMRPRWKEIEQENPWLLTTYFEYDDNPKIVQKYNLESGNLPVFIFLDKNQEEITRLTGEISKKEILETINKYKDA